MTHRYQCTIMNSHLYSHVIYFETSVTCFFPSTGNKSAITYVGVILMFNVLFDIPCDWLVIQDKIFKVVQIKIANLFGYYVGYKTLSMSCQSPWRHLQLETFSALLALCAGNNPHTGQWRGALLFSFICAWINGWINNGKAGDLRRHRGHYNVTAMQILDINGCPSLDDVTYEGVFAMGIPSASGWYWFSGFLTSRHRYQVMVVLHSYLSLFSFYAFLVASMIFDGLYVTRFRKYVCNTVLKWTLLIYKRSNPATWDPY